MRAWCIGLGLTLLAASGPAQETPLPGAQVYITTDPPGSVIVFDGAAQPTSPCTMESVTPGRHLIIARKAGHREARLSVVVSAGQRLPVDMKLEVVHGLAIIHSKPSGADISIDGAHRGRTPLLITDLPLGKHRVKFETIGYKDKVVVLNVSDRTPRKISENLISDSARIILNSEPQGASVLLNGVERNKTPCVIDRIPSGIVELGVQLSGYHDYQHTLRVTAGEVIPLNIELKEKPGTMSIISIPDRARVYIGDEPRGVTPLTVEDLLPGTYHIAVEAPGYSRLVRDVTMRKSQTLREEFRLAKNSGMLELITEPAGASVYIDGEARGVTRRGRSDQVSERFTADLLKIGPHTVQISKKGYYARKLKVQIKKAETVTLHEKLERRFIPDTIVLLKDLPQDSLRGVISKRHPNGDVELETLDNIFTTIKSGNIVEIRPIVMNPEE